MDNPANMEEFSPVGVGAASKDRTYGGLNSKLDGALFNDFEPGQRLKHEDILHRRAAEMAVAGLTNIEIAATLGYTPEYVSTILRQPYAREHMLRAAKNEGQELRDLLAVEGMRSLKNLITIANNPNIKTVDAIAANSKIVDRWLGKESQPITISDAKPEELADDELNRRIAERLAATASRTN